MSDLLDAAGAVPFKVWLAIALLGAAVAGATWLIWEAFNAPLMDDPEEREHVARLYSEWGGHGPTRSTRSTVRRHSSGAFAKRHTTRHLDGRAATAQGDPAHRRGRPRRPRNT